MMKRAYCGKKTKIYIPKTVNPKIISYNSNGNENNLIQNNIMSIKNENTFEEYSAKRR